MSGTAAVSVVSGEGVRRDTGAGAPVLATDALLDAQEQLAHALVEAQDRLDALSILAGIGFQTLSTGEAIPRVLEEAQNITGSDVTLLVDNDELFKTGALEDPDVDRLAEALEMVFTRDEMMLQKPRLLNAGRTVVMSFKKGGNLGCHMIFHRRGGRAYATGDMALIGSIAGFTESMYELTRLHRRELEHAGFEKEHIAASGIAQAALDLPLPAVPGTDIFGASIPASIAGGDFFVALHAHGRLWFVVGDVAGKGLPAALVMSRAVSAARAAFLTTADGDAADALYAVSTEMFGYLGKVGLFITLAVGCYDPRSGLLEICNAGHSPVVLAGVENVESIPSTSPPVGVLQPRRRTPIISRQLRDGDCLVVGSDGLVEQSDETGAMYGYQRFLDCCRKQAGKRGTAAEVGWAIFDQVARFGNRMPPSDDRTLLVIRIGEAMETNRLVLLADPLSLRGIGPWLEEGLGGLDAAEAAELKGRLELAVHEVAMNIVDHSGLSATDTMELALDVTGAAAEVRIADKGSAFELPEDAVEGPSEPRIRGYGLLIVGQLVDSFSCQRFNSTNHWTLRVDRATRRGNQDAG